MKKIKILTFSRAHNYGALLQAYALQNILNLMNNDTEILDYRNENIERPYKRINLEGKPKNKIKNVLKFICKHRLIINRYNNFNKFIENKLRLTKSVYTDEQMNNTIKGTDILITGSDQVWSRKIVGELSNIYTLNFKTNCLRISYAASIGDSSDILKYKDEYKKKISIIDYISVRERDAKNNLETIISKPIQETLDPTLLLTRDDWNMELQKIGVEEEKYILAYVVAPDDEYIKIVNEISEKTKLKVIHFGLKNPGYKNVLKTAYTEGPLEFVNYIKNAEYIVATSFHATVFAIIFNKRFFIVPHKKTGSRVTNLLGKLGIDGRTFQTLEEFKNVDYNFDTDWKKVEERLNVERKKSIEWLKNAIEG